MSTEQLYLAGMDIEVVYKSIKNLHIGVYPPDGRVRVAAPPSMSSDAVRVAVLTKLPWIAKRRRDFQQQPRENTRAYVSGETHWHFGRPLRLRVETAMQERPGIQVEGNDALRMRLHPDATFEDRERMILKWYRAELRIRGRDAVERWAKTLDVPTPDFGIKRMRTKWGSCNPDTGRVWLNLSLAKKPSQTIEYVALHEMAHFISRRHDDAFIAVLDRLMPTWRKVRSELNALPLDAW